MPPAARRWDADERGAGVAGGCGHLPALRELVELAGLPDWVAEDPETHLLPGLQRTAEVAGLTIRSAAVEPDGTFTVHVAGAANVSKRALRQAVWSMLGGVAEMSAHVREIRDTNGVRFEMLTGMPPGEGPFPTHGHRLRLVIAETA